MTIPKGCVNPPFGSKRPFCRLRRADHDPRAAALTVLSQVLHGNADSRAALDAALQSPLMPPVDKSLCTELVYGILRRYIALEAFIRGFLPRPDKLPEEMRLALHLALYEMACLRIPHHASVGWTVNHVRNRFGQGLSRVANGVLRAMQRKLPDFADLRRISRSAASEEERLSLLYSVPAWIVSLWLNSYGLEAALLLLDASGRPPPAGLRLNRACPDWERTKNELTPLPEAGDQGRIAKKGTTDASSREKGVLPVGPCALVFLSALPRQARVLLKEGKASRQSAASYEILEAFSPGSWQLPVWDCCAGRGGKTLALLEQGIAVELASDPSGRRLRALPEEYARLKLAAPPCPEILPLSVEEVAARLTGQAQPQRYGTILIDAPCSGLGTLSRRPEIRFRRTREDLDTLAGLQKSILALAWTCLRSGGSLVYLTCTINPAENEQQVADFLAAHNDAALLEEVRTDFSSLLREFFYGARIRKS